MPNKHDIRSEQTKKLLRETMRSLIAKENFDHITVNQICLLISISRTTFYQYYQDKFDLLVDCVFDLIDPKEGQIEEDRLEEYFNHTLEISYTYRKIFNRLLNYDGTREVQHKMDARFSELFLRYYCAKEKEGATFVAPIDMLAECVCVSVNTVISYWIQNNFKPPKEEIVKLLISTVRSPIIEPK